jgi:hypothetical protein
LEVIRGKVLGPVDVDQDGLAAGGSLQRDIDWADQLVTVYTPFQRLTNFWLEPLAEASK